MAERTTSDGLTTCYCGAEGVVHDECAARHRMDSKNRKAMKKLEKKMARSRYSRQRNDPR